MRMTIVSRAAATALLISASLSTRPLSAQTTFGLLFGGNSARFAGLDLSSGDVFNGTSSIKSRLGVQAGVYVNKRLSPTWSLQPEVHYTQKGTTLAFGGSQQVDGELGFKFAYAEVPLLLRADFGTGTWRPFVTVGPTLALRLSCNAEATAEDFSVQVDCDEFEDESETSQDPFTTSDIGGSVGIGFAGRMTGRAATIQVRYGRSLVGLLTDAASNASDTQKPKHSVISVVFGLGR